MIRRRPASAPAVRVPKLALKLPLPIEVVGQAWAVDACAYKGLPLRPQPQLRIRHTFRLVLSAACFSGVQDQLHA